MLPFSRSGRPEALGQARQARGAHWLSPAVERDITYYLIQAAYGHRWDGNRPSTRFPSPASSTSSPRPSAAPWPGTALGRAGDFHDSVRQWHGGAAGKQSCLGAGMKPIIAPKRPPAPKGTLCVALGRLLPGVVLLDVALSVLLFCFGYLDTLAHRFLP